MKKSLILLLVLLVPILSIAESLPIIRKVGDFSFKESKSKTINQDILDGKTTIINFFFTSCQTVCPTMNLALKSTLGDKLKDPSLQIISISVDPEHDSFEALNAYKNKFELPDNWHLVRGDISQVKDFLINGVGLGAIEDPTLHTTRLVVVDSDKNIRAYVQSVDPEEMSRLPTMLNNN